MLVFTLTGVISLLNYENPQIQQYSVFDSRNDNVTVNMDDSYGEIAFGFIDLQASRFVPPDPTICSLLVQTVSLYWANPSKLQVYKDLDIASVTREKNAEHHISGEEYHKSAFNAICELLNLLK